MVIKFRQAKNHEIGVQDREEENKAIVKTRQKYWDVCDGSCKNCWPKVYAACKSKKKVNRVLMMMEDMLERQESDSEAVRFVTKIVRQGFIEIF